MALLGNTQVLFIYFFMSSGPRDILWVGHMEQMREEIHETGAKEIV